jgi:hypothetical protein
VLTDMYTTQVHTSGRAVAGLSGDASSAGQGFLKAVSSAQETVVHPTVSGALGAYHGRWSQPANRMAHDVDALGNNTAQSAVDIQTGDNDAGATGQNVAMDGQSMADRLNGGSVLAV